MIESALIEPPEKFCRSRSNRRTFDTPAERSAGDSNAFRRCSNRAEASAIAHLAKG